MIVTVLPRALNALANLPDVRPGLGPGGQIDLTWVYRYGGVALGSLGVPGAVVLEKLSPAAFRGHFLFPKESRGAVALAVSREVAEWVFTHYDIACIHGLTPRDNRAALAFARRLGCVPKGTALDAGGAECIKFELTRERWVSLQAVRKVRRGTKDSVS